MNTLELRHAESRRELITTQHSAGRQGLRQPVKRNLARNARTNVDPSTVNITESCEEILGLHLSRAGNLGNLGAQENESI